MKQINKGIICLLSGMALFVSCNDEWDAHYDRNGSVPQVSLMDLLRNDASLSTFTQIVEITGTDSLLVSDQTYTVWAPVNEALTNVDMTDRAALERLVKTILLVTLTLLLRSLESIFICLMVSVWHMMMQSRSMEHLWRMVMNGRLMVFCIS